MCHSVTGANINRLRALNGHVHDDPTPNVFLIPKPTVEEFQNGRRHAGKTVITTYLRTYWLAVSWTDYSVSKLPNRRPQIEQNMWGCRSFRWWLCLNYGRYGWESKSIHAIQVQNFQGSIFQYFCEMHMCYQSDGHCCDAKSQNVVLRFIEFCLKITTVLSAITGR